MKPREGITITAGLNNTVVVSKMCSIEGTVYSVVAPHQGWQRWLEGGLMQNALPSLNACQREFLISGLTPAEFEAEFSEEEKA